MNIETIKQLFYNELQSDKEFMESVWINYPEDRLIREKTALNQFIRLYSGEQLDILSTDTELQSNIKVLDLFCDDAKCDISLTKKLIKDFFNEIKLAYQNQNELIKTSDLSDLKEIIHWIGTDNIINKRKEFEKLKKLYSQSEEEKLSFNDSLSIEELEKLKLEIISLNNKNLIHSQNSFDEELINKAIADIEDIIIKKQEWNKILQKLDSQYEIYYKKISELKKIWGDNSLTASLGWDLSSADFTEENLFKLKKNAEYLEIENNEALNRLMQLLGNSSKNKKNANKRNMRKGIDTISKNELLGVHNSSDLARVLPSELSYLNNKYLKYRFYMKYAESELNTYLIADNSEENRKQDKNNSEGPFIACIDTSSSMEGLPEIISKSVVIKLIKMAKKQKRKLYLILFGSIDEIEEFEIDYSENSTKKLYEFLNHTFFGGTDFVTPIKRSIELINSKKYNKADILMISDGVAKVPDEFIQKINRDKNKFKFEIYSLIIGNKNIQDKFSDKIFYYKHKGQEKKLDKSFTRRDVSFYADEVSLFID